MPDIKIKGIDVSFPYTPYKCQIDYMEKVIIALSTRSHAALESPTGTGKTLCLLCAVLAWHKANVPKQQLVNRVKDLLGGETKDTRSIPTTRIYYTSRTHGQLKNVVKELKKTSYLPKMTILGSRNQLCVHEEVKKLANNVMKNHLCKSKVKSRTCFYHKNEQKRENIPIDPIFDIEDVVKACRSCNICPYYHVKHRVETSEFVLMPYNYLIDPRNRKANSLDLSNSIVIIDEAHNIDKACEESFSCDLSLSDIQMSRNQIQRAIDLVQEHELSPFNCPPDGEPNCQVPNMDDLLLLKKSVSDLESRLSKITFSKNEILLTHQDAVKMVIDCGFVIENVEKIENFIETVIEYLSSKKLNTTKLTLSLNKLSTYVSIVVNSQKYITKDQGRFFRLLITKDIDKYDAAKNEPFLKFWCFSPSLAIQSILLENVRSIIFTSGTLSPLSLFLADVQLAGAIQLENSHVIQEDQLKLFILPRACDNSTILISTYQHRANELYLEMLGKTILEIIKLVPGGILTFFPSYSSLNLAVDKWKRSQTWIQINSIKTIHQETKDKLISTNIFTASSKDFIIMAVCRGKLSEGIDFSDDYARAVIITGLPFPSRHDPQIELKIQVMDEFDNSGTKWYSQQAIRSVNQAIGRVIRHKDDYGLVFLLDERFQLQRIRPNFCKWTNNHVVNFTDFRDIKNEVTQFFASRSSIQNLKFQELIPQKRAASDATRDDQDIYRIYENKENIPERPKNESIFTKLRKTKSLNESFFSYKLKSYGNDQQNKPTIKIKGPLEQKSSKLNINLRVSQLVEKLKNSLNKDQFLLLYEALKNYIKDKNIVTFMQQIEGIPTPDLYTHIEKIIDNDHKIVFQAFLEHYACPNPLEIFLKEPETVTEVKCSKCSRKAPYKLPCGHANCSRCYVESAHAGRKCITCKKTYLIDDVVETFCSED